MLFLFQEPQEAVSFKMDFTKELVNNLANSLLFNLTDKEAKEVLEEFSSIKESMDLINNIDGLKDYEPLANFNDEEIFLLREDDETDNLSTNDVLANCENIYGSEVKLPKVVTK